VIEEVTKTIGEVIGSMMVEIMTEGTREIGISINTTIEMEATTTEMAMVTETGITQIVTDTTTTSNSNQVFTKTRTHNRFTTNNTRLFWIPRPNLRNSSNLTLSTKKHSAQPIKARPNIRLELLLRFHRIT
jgi:hypothetical protein